MELYYGRDSGDNKIMLDEDESNHLLKVNRKRLGDAVEVTDGEGHLFISHFIEKIKHNCILQIEKRVDTPSNKNHLHIAIAPTKNSDRLEWFLEKATECGIDEISLLVCRHSERKDVKEERLKRVLVSAMKQSLKTFLPKLNPVISFTDFVNTAQKGLKLIFTTEVPPTESLHMNYHKGKSLTALIGPEGDFHGSEIELAKSLDYKPTSLGTSRLRTETAGLNVCMLFNFINVQ